MSALQLDLFGEVEAAEDAAAAEAAQQAARAKRSGELAAEWEARFQIGVYRLRNNLGQWQRGPRLGFQCPDPWCNTVTDAYNLERGHGYNPFKPGTSTFDGRCHSVRRLELTTHRLTDLEITEDGFYQAACCCREVLFQAVERAELAEQLADHAAHVRQPKPDNDEWSTESPGWAARWRA